MERSSDRVFKEYSLYSLGASLLLWVGFFVIYQNQFLEKTFFLSFLVVGNAYVYLHHQVAHESWADNITYYFLGQALLLGGISYEIQSVLPWFLAIVPASTYTLTQRQEEEKVKGILLFFITISASLGLRIVFENHTNKSFFELEMLFLVASAFWSLGSSYFSNLGKDLYHLLMRQSKMSALKEIDDGYKNRLFFHDVINQTHGVSLYLNHKLSLDEPLQPDEIRAVDSEIMNLQSILQDHFNMNHKNILKLDSVVSFDKAMEGILPVIENYIPKFKAHRSLILKSGLQEVVSSGKGGEEYPVHFASFIRILTNVIKNISEQSSSEVIFEFDYIETGLNVLIKNKIFRLTESKIHLAENLQDIILSEDQKEERPTSPLGLESIAFLCDSQGGKASFYIENSFWVTQIFLPRPELNPKLTSASFDQAA